MSSKLAALAAAAAATLSTANTDLSAADANSGIDPKTGPSTSQLVLLSEKLAHAPVSITKLDAASTALHLLGGALNLTFAANGGANTAREQGNFTTSAQYSLTQVLMNPDSHGSHALAEAGLARLELIKKS